MQSQGIVADHYALSISRQSAYLVPRLLRRFAVAALVVCALALALPRAAGATPFLINPVAGAQVPYATQVFNWGDTYSEGPLDHWYLEIATSPETEYYPFGYFPLGNLAYASGHLNLSTVDLNAIGRALGPGVYYWHVVGYYGPFGSAGTAWTPVRSFTVQNSGVVVAPEISVNPASLAFTVSEGDTDTHEQILDISNTGGSTLQFAAVAELLSPQWLSITPGTNTGTVYSLPVRVSVGSLAPGTYTGRVRIQDNGSVPAATNSPVYVPVTLKVLPASLEAAGSTRFDTAVDVSEEAFPDGAETVVIATGRNWPDALGGSALAGALDGPVLLVDTNKVPSAVLNEIDRLKADKAVILGGTAAVESAVESALKVELGAGNVERIAGTDRYKTADAVAKRVIEIRGIRYDGKAFVATGDNFPDALAAAPLAAAKSWPLYLAHPTKGLSAGTKAAMADVESVLVLGGTAAVSSAVETYLNSSYGSGEVTRLEGAHRYATAVAVATYGVQKAGLGWNRAGIATGENYPDALAGGVLQGKVGSVMLLTPSASLHSATNNALTAHKNDIDTVTFFGGTSAVSQPVRDAVESAVD